MDRIIYFFDERSLSRYIKKSFLYLAGALKMEHFLKGITRLIHCGTLTQKRRVKNIQSDHRSLHTSNKGPIRSIYFKKMFHFRHLINVKLPFMYWQRSAFNEINDC